MTILRLMHGTSSKALEQMRADGAMKSPIFLSDHDETANYYAECASEEDDSDPVVIIIEVNSDLLVRDDPSFAEPLSFIKSLHGIKSDADWMAAFVSGDLSYPKGEYDFTTSLQVVRSVMCLAELPVSAIYKQAIDAESLSEHVISVN